MHLGRCRQKKTATRNPFSFDSAGGRGEGCRVQHTVEVFHAMFLTPLHSSCARICPHCCRAAGYADHDQPYPLPKLLNEYLDLTFFFSVFGSSIPPCITTKREPRAFDLLGTRRNDCTATRPTKARLPRDLQHLQQYHTGSVQWDHAHHVF